MVQLWAYPCEKVQDGQGFWILFFLHETEEKCHRICFLVFLLPKSEENLIYDVIKCCQYKDKFYYVIWSYTET